MNPLKRPRSTVDFETRSELDLTEVGAWAYSEHPSTEIISMAWKIRGKKNILWTPERPFPQELIDHYDSGGSMVCHGSQFERAIWLNVLRRNHPTIPMPRWWIDTMATCAYKALPLALDKVGEVLDIPIKKDQRGKYLIQQLCKPRKPLKKERAAWKQEGGDPTKMPVLWREDWGLQEEMYDYNLLDVDAEECLEDTIGDLPLPEYKIWVLDQKINYRGITVDMDAVHKAFDIVKVIADKYEYELQELTGLQVQTGTEVKRMKEWIEKQGVEIPDLQKDTVEHFLKKIDLPEKVYRVLEIRQILSRASTAKLIKFANCTSKDGRLRGLLQYHGAGTGRWAGRLVQPQNFPRGTIFGADFDKLFLIIKTMNKYDAIEALELCYGDPMEAIASSLRGMMVAAVGHVLRVSDFSAIEARVLMWLAGENSSLEVFRLSDAGKGPDIYCSMAEKLYKRPINKKDDSYERQLGKIVILGCGYQMSGPRLKEQAETDYGVILTDAEADFLVQTYREGYLLVPELWEGLSSASIQAIEKDRPVSFRGITYFPHTDAAGKWLACRLPNGRDLWYYNPKVSWEMMPWGKKKKCLSYEGRDNKRGGKWGRVRTYGGMLTENVVQAISRDLMVEAMVRVEEKGYPIILTVHDEIISETKKDFGSQEEFETLMKIVPPWAMGCPIGVEGGVLTRYRKI